MPWPSVPYDNNILRTNLTECFNVRGIPYLVLIDNNGNIITENGRAEIIEDPDGSVRLYILFGLIRNNSHFVLIYSIFRGEKDLYILFLQDFYLNFRVTQL
jgi:hypothetical protein